VGGEGPEKRYLCFLWLRDLHSRSIPSEWERTARVGCAKRVKTLVRVSGTSCTDGWRVKCHLLVSSAGCVVLLFLLDMVLESRWCTERVNRGGERQYLSKMSDSLRTKNLAFWLCVWMPGIKLKGTNYPNQLVYGITPCASSETMYATMNL